MAAVAVGEVRRRHGHGGRKGRHGVRRRRVGVHDRVGGLDRRGGAGAVSRSGHQQDLLDGVEQEVGGLHAAHVDRLATGVPGPIVRLSRAGEPASLVAAQVAEGLVEGAVDAPGVLRAGDVGAVELASGAPRPYERPPGGTGLEVRPREVPRRLERAVVLAHVGTEDHEVVSAGRHGHLVVREAAGAGQRPGQQPARRAAAAHDRVGGVHRRATDDRHVAAGVAGLSRIVQVVHAVVHVVTRPTFLG